MAKDVHCQRVYNSNSLSPVADTITVGQVTESYLPQDKVGWVIQKVKYSVENSLIAQLNTDGDRVKFGLSFLDLSGVTGGPEANDAGIIDWHSVTRVDLAAPAADVVFFEKNPIAETDFSTLEGKGWIVHPCNLFSFTYPDAALAAACIFQIEITYFTIELTPDLYAELWQSIYVRA